MEQVTSCNFCGNGNLIKIYEDIVDEVSKEKFNIIRCMRCNLMMTSPRPESNEIARYYPRTYYSYTESKDYFSSRIALLIKKYYVLPPENIIKRMIIGFFAVLLKRFVAVIIEGEGKSRNILDVGCGDGRRISWLIEYNYNVYGTEISEDACNIAKSRGIKVFCGDLLEAKYPESFFDIVIFSQVFEHLLDPQRTLEECYRIMKKESILIIDVPNIESLNYRIYGKFWFPLEVPRHLFHFSKQTVCNYLKKNRFTVIQWKYRYPKFFDIASIKKIYKFGGFFLLVKSLLFSLFSIFLYPLAKNKDELFSRTICAVCKKIEV